MMKSLLSLFLIMLVSPLSLAGTVDAILKSQTVQVLGEEVNPTSCRMYRKRLDQFLQRVDEAYHSTRREGRIGLSEARDLLNILQRSGNSLAIGEDKILWTVEFDLGETAQAFNSNPLNIELKSPYLQWETTTGFFPDHFQVKLNEDRRSLKVSYRLSYLEACLAPLGFSIVITDDQGTSVRMETPYNRDLIE